MQPYFDDYKKSADYIQSKIKEEPELLLILGSGLGYLADEVDDSVIIPFSEIHDFKTSTAPSHEGKLVVGRFMGKKVAVMKGRVHYYEGYSFAETAFPIRVMKLIGIKNMITTNAAGGINMDFEPGDLMLIKDHIKFFDDSPLRGVNISEFGPRFNDMSFSYSKKLQDLARACAVSENITLREGVYAFMPGPQYETPAEIRALRILGADAVGMSTVAEVITAAHCGIDVLGISCISNMAAGILDAPLTEHEVIEVAMREKDKFSRLILKIIEKM